MDKVIAWFKGLYAKQPFVGYVPTKKEKEEYWSNHHKELKEQMLFDFYNFLDLKSLFGDDAESDWSKYAVWIGLGVNVITLIFVFIKLK
jgi:hypothetical protein